MLPFTSFMKKMVAQDGETQQGENSGNASGGTTFGKLKQTLSSSLLTAQDKVNKMSPNQRPSIIPDAHTIETLHHVHSSSILETRTTTEKEPESTTSLNNEKNEPNKTANRARESSCRVCLKSFKPDDFSKTCYECKYRVCEDCASYSKMDSAEDLNTWRCSVCRRKMSSRICIPQDSTDSNLDVPVLEALQRRHSDVKLNTTTANSVAGIGLAPPRSPELRRHSDVSPASLRELEKLKKEQRTSSSLNTDDNSNDDNHWSGGIPGLVQIEPPTRVGSRRQSRVSRQHSYDDDIQKNAIANMMKSDIDLGLGAPVPPMPRRKSAYDVFGGVQMPPQPNSSSLSQMGSSSELGGGDKPPGSRRASFRIADDYDAKEQELSPKSPEKTFDGPTLLIDDDRRIRRRGSQLPDISALRERGVLNSNPAAATLSVNPSLNPYQGPALEDLEAPKRQASLDGEAIKIVIHDFDSGPLCATKRRIVIRRDPNDKGHRTRGFGMRVVGGKTGADGKLFACVVWTVPGGPAEKSGLQQGDKIIEWCGVSLIDRSFEEVCSIMSMSEGNDVVELLVEHASDFRMCDFLEDGNVGGGPPLVSEAQNVRISQPPPQQQQQHQQPPIINTPQLTLTNPVVSQRKNSDVGLIVEPDSNEKTPASPTRRKLPKTPV